MPRGAPSRHITLRIPQDVASEIEATAKVFGRSIAAEIVDRLQRVPGSERLVTDRPEPAAPVGTSDPEACAHPREARRTFTWGSVCAVCKARL